MRHELFLDQSKVQWPLKVVGFMSILVDETPSVRKDTANLDLVRALDKGTYSADSSIILNRQTNLQPIMCEFSLESTRGV